MMAECIPNFVSRQEHYKQTPEMDLETIAAMDIQPAAGRHLNFARLCTCISAGGDGRANSAV